MREPLDQILRNLAVSYVLAPYETQPWFFYDEESGVTCSAEVRMGAGGQDVEAEIQLLKEEDDDSEDGEQDAAGGREQILWMRVEPVTDEKWELRALRIKGKNYVNEFHGWEEKGCQFFRSCVEAMQMDEMPNFDVLVEQNMRDDTSGGGGRSGRVGRKSPNVKPGQLMGMKK